MPDPRTDRATVEQTLQRLADDFGSPCNDDSCEGTVCAAAKLLRALLAERETLAEDYDAASVQFRYMKADARKARETPCPACEFIAQVLRDSCEWCSDDGMVALNTVESWVLARHRALTMAHRDSCPNGEAR